ncbi:class E basic helix-loop-helix protein 22 [Herpailurus yagouaroundi]|uniref:class E basic helix-loop-helix protein 22 n=1 Tax=Herpailurus yagouaroundi TaxID=1608482 RepID=UPI001AD7CFCD|nr:class E basic helix-loop-helix protein 22 [Puma yagouaroundi]
MERGLHLGAAASGEDDLFLHKSLSASTAKRLEAAFRSTPPGMDLSLAPPPRERPASSSSSPLGCFEPADPEGAGLLLPPPGGGGGGAGGGGGGGGGVGVPGLLVGSAGVGGDPSLSSLPAGAALCLKYGESASRGSVAESSGGEQSPDDDSDGRCELVLRAGGADPRASPGAGGGGAKAAEGCSNAHLHGVSAASLPSSAAAAAAAAALHPALGAYEQAAGYPFSAGLPPAASCPEKCALFNSVSSSLCKQCTEKP